MRTAVLATVLLFAFTSLADDSHIVVHRFYTAYIAAKPAGLPDGDTLKALAPFLSEHLHALIVDALRYRDEVRQAHPEDKPPFVDGDHFTSVFEGPRAFEIVRAEGSEVRVRFTDEPEITWEDVVIVKEEGGRWVIDDVVFSGLGEFNPPGRLSDRLTVRDEG